MSDFIGPLWRSYLPRTHQGFLLSYFLTGATWHGRGNNLWSGLRPDGREGTLFIGDGNLVYSGGE